MRARAGVSGRDRALGERVVRLGLVLALAFGGVMLGAGYWQVLRADDLSGEPTDAGVIAARSGAFVSVARQGRTCMASMMELVASLRDSSTHSFGFVLNEH